MKSAPFSKLSFASLLVVAGMSGCGDTGDGSGNAGQYSATCTDPTAIQVCACPTPGQNGVQKCENGLWGICFCGTMGAGGSPITNPPPGGQNGARCGDGVISPPEQCDGQAQNGLNCQSASMGACAGGTLVCNGSCQFDFSMCTGCNGGGPGGAGGTMGTGGTFGGGGVGGVTGQP